MRRPHGRGVRAAAAEGGDVSVAAHALEAGNDNHFAVLQVGAHFGVVDVFDAGFGVGVVGFQRHLPAGVAFGFDADAFERHRQQADGDLLAGGEDDVEFARIGNFLNFLRQGNQAVGFAAHRGHHHHHVVPFGAGFGHPFGNVFNPFDGTDRGAAVFLNNQSHNAAFCESGWGLGTLPPLRCSRHAVE